MNEFDPITPRQNDDAQKHRPCGDDTACLVTTLPHSLSQLHDFDHYTAPASFALSGSLRVQWASTTPVQRPVTLDV